MSTKPKPDPKPRRASAVVPESLHGPIVDRLKSTNAETGRPYTSREVAAWALDAHGIKCSHMAILRVKAVEAERGNALIVEALRAELRDAVWPAKAKLARALRRLDALAARSKSVKDLSAAVNATTRALHELAHLGGVAAPVAVDLTSGGQPLAIALRWADAPVSENTPDDHASGAAPATE